MDGNLDDLDMTLEDLAADIELYFVLWIVLVRRRYPIFPEPTCSRTNMCNSMCCSICAGISAFGMVYMAILGALIQFEYPYVGVWYGSEDLHHHTMIPTEEAMEQGGKNFYAAAGVNGAVFVLTLILTCTFASQERRKKAKQ
eukprot:TRINITY_DN392_c1_g1_i1.p2 TRINITY_DN392_c1_g1~~TRINITY_DN392_c1_g1_i1.p2  ORF type:complete len:152 (+),score=16.09 TRINITY_DN392_c1_g1_i1:32-457(+)